MPWKQRIRLASSCASKFLRLEAPLDSAKPALYCRLTGYFKDVGVHAVFDTNTGRDIALLEAAAEFIERYKAAHPEYMEKGASTIVLSTRESSCQNKCAMACY